MKKNINDDFNDYIDEVDKVDDIVELKNKRNKRNMRNKKDEKKEMGFQERYNLINEDLKIIKWKGFSNEDCTDNEDNTDEDLNPQKYDLDEELSKVAIKQINYFVNLNSNRKKFY